MASGFTGVNFVYKEAAPRDCTPAGLDARSLFAYETNDTGHCVASPFLELLKAHRYENRELRVAALAEDDPHRATVLAKVAGTEPWASPVESRAVACMLGMSLGDAIGSAVEFEPYSKKGCGRVTGMGTKTQGAFSLQPGQYTDDCSMGLCLADSLMLHDGEFDPHDLMLRFLAWWHLGYNNGLQGRHSVGLGGNISMSLGLYPKRGEPYTSAGDLKTSGNGSVMRNASPAVAHHDNLDKAMDIAYKQSKVTHQGDEAAEACRLLTFVCVRAINGDGTKEAALTDLSAFTSPDPALQCMAQSTAELLEGNPDPDRNWNWRDPQFRYSPKRAKQQPGYVGSYSLDALAMALHCVWNTNSFAEAILVSANKCGDADSVTSVTGQIAGAIYGVGGDKGVPSEWYAVQQKWDRHGDVPLRAYRMVNKLYPA